MKGTVVVARDATRRHADGDRRRSPATPTATPTPAPRIEAHDTTEPAATTGSRTRRAPTRRQHGDGQGRRAGRRSPIPAGASSHDVTFRRPEAGTCVQTTGRRRWPIRTRRRRRCRSSRSRRAGRATCTFDAPGHVHVRAATTHRGDDRHGRSSSPAASRPRRPPRRPRRPRRPRHARRRRPRRRPARGSSPTTRRHRRQELVPGRVEHRPGRQHGHGRQGRDRRLQLPGRRAARTTSCSTTNPTSCVQKTGLAITTGAAAAGRTRCRAGWTRRVHVRHAGRLHVRVHGAPDGDDGHGGGQERRRRGADADADRHADRDAHGHARAAARHDAGEGRRDRGPRSTSPTVKAMTVSSFLTSKLKIVARCVSAGSGHADAVGLARRSAKQIGLEAARSSAPADAHLRRPRPLHGQGQTERAAETALEDYRGSVQTHARRSRWPARSAQTTATRTITSRARGARDELGT